MLAEAFILRLEMLRRVADATPSVTVSDTRFVPVSVPAREQPASVSQSK